MEPNFFSSAPKSFAIETFRHLGCDVEVWEEPKLVTIKVEPSSLERITNIMATCLLPHIAFWESVKFCEDRRLSERLLKISVQSTFVTLCPWACLAYYKTLRCSERFIRSGFPENPQKLTRSYLNMARFMASCSDIEGRDDIYQALTQELGSHITNIENATNHRLEAARIFRLFATHYDVSIKLSAVKAIPTKSIFYKPGDCVPLENAIRRERIDTFILLAGAVTSQDSQKPLANKIMAIIQECYSLCLSTDAAVERPVQQKAQSLPDVVKLARAKESISDMCLQTAEDLCDAMITLIGYIESTNVFETLTTNIENIIKKTTYNVEGEEILIMFAKISLKIADTVKNLHLNTALISSLVTMTNAALIIPCLDYVTRNQLEQLNQDFKKAEKSGDEEITLCTTRTTRSRRAIPLPGAVDSKGYQW